MKKLAIRLNDSDRLYLERYVNKGSHSARAIKRARVLLLLDVGKSVKEAAAFAGVSQATVYNLLQRHKQEKGAVSRAIEEKARPGQPAKITPEVEAHLTALACSKAPAGRSQWTLRLLSEKVVELGQVDELSHEAVRKCLKSKLKPWQKKQWCIGQIDGEYLAAMEDVLEVYEHPGQQTCIRLCLDERPCQLLDEVICPLPMK